MKSVIVFSIAVGLALGALGATVLPPNGGKKLQIIGIDPGDDGPPPTMCGTCHETN